MKQHLITSAVGTSVTFDAKILNHEQLKHLGAFARLYWRLKIPNIDKL